MSTKRGLYFDEFTVGLTTTSPSRIVTDANVMTFAQLSGDFNQIHIDDEYAKTSSYGQRIAHGLLVQAIASGLALRTGVLEGTVVAFREMTCKFSAPVFIGDTIRVTLEVIETKAMRRLNVGNVLVQFRVIKQDDTIVQRGNWRFLVKLQPT
jgi:acyl dehydratase